MDHLMKRIVLVIFLLALNACSTNTPQRYSISADNNVALKTLKVGNINVGDIKGPADFNNGCRAAGPIAFLRGAVLFDLVY